MGVIEKLWDGGLYTYQLTYTGVNSSIVNGKAVILVFLTNVEVMKKKE